MKDLELKDKRIFKMVRDENKRQIKKWGVQNQHPFEWLAFTVEEIGEMSQAISNYLYNDNSLRTPVVNEAIQSATLCLKIAEMFLNEKTTHE